MIKIYIDENFSPYLASGLNILEKPNREGFEVLSIKKEFGGGVKDEDWIPKVGQEDGIAITQDFNIQRTRHLKEMYIKHGVGVFFIRAPSKGGFQYWDFVILLINRWKRLKKLAKKNKVPFAFRCSSRSKDFDDLMVNG